MVVMPCGERPDASTTCAPASRARWTASYVAGGICSYVAPAPSIHWSSVPSMSSATMRGRQPGRGSAGGATASAIDRLEDLEAAEVRAQRLGHPHRPVGLLVGLEDRHDG